MKILFGLLALVGLYAANLYHYLLFHTLAEGISIIVACTFFLIVWNSRRFLENSYLLFLGIGYFFIAGIDLVHALAYKGMNIFPGYGADLAIQLWIVARYLESLTLLIAPLFLYRAFNVRIAFGGYALLFTLSLVIIFSGLFPVCFIEGKGLTAFKVNSEYFISLLLLVAIFLLLRCRSAFDVRILRLMLISLALTISAELAFTFYVKVYGISNVFGHYFKLLSFYCIYKAIIETGLNKPYSLLFRELKQSEEEADTANRAKSIFLANMSHEIRTPMNAVIGFTELCLQTGLSVQQRNYLNKARDSAASLLGLINDILDFSKIEAGKLEMECVPFQPSAAVEHLLSQLSSAAQDKSLALRSKVADDIPIWLKGDPLRLKQILVNLLNNAIKFTDNGKVEISVALREQGENSVKLEFMVCDSGIGISAEKQQKLFHAFSQGDATTTRKYGGTGLGLAISRQLAELMDGGIGMESEPGRGSTFRFTARFERASEEEIANALRFKSEKTYSQQLYSIQGAHILLAEDNPINQQLATEILQQAGLRVTVADNGKEALATLAEEGAFDAVLMDIQMPEMGGYEAARLIRDNPRYEKLPVIAMTANALKGDEQKCLNAGMNDYVAKPIDVAQLFAVLGKWIKPEQGLPAPPRVKIEEARQGGLPDKLPGIDIAAGLERLGGNKRLFKKLLMDFRQDNADTVQMIREALAKEEQMPAQHLAHTLKGVAANLSMESLSGAAKSLETAVRQGEKARFAGLLEEAEQCLTEVLEAAATLEPNEPRPAYAGENETPSDMARLAPLLRELNACLKQRNMKAKNHWAELKKHLPASVQQNDMVQLETFINKLEFKDARKSLAKLAGLLDISLERN
ncbi:MAG: response regulator [Gammaproteobacteria bacterium]|nr:response regulator [Gammaproteobacteria bacterium]